MYHHHIIEETSTHSTFIPKDFPSPSSPLELFGPALLDNNKDREITLSTADSPPLEVTEEAHFHHDEEEDDDDDETTSEEEDEESSHVPDELPAVDTTSQAEESPLGHVIRRDVSTETERRGEIPAADRPSNVSILGGRYLLLSNTAQVSTTGPIGALSSTLSSKSLQKCVHVETREQFLYKVVSKNPAGLTLLGAYHRLEEASDCLNPIREIIVSPKNFYLIFPVNYGNVHAYLLAKKRLRECEAAHLFKQMVSAVKNCHSRGIILRDLKLGKFVFTDKERTTIKLESLDDAVVLEDGSDDGLADKHGCPNYVSPEKAEILRSNCKYPGKATDIWGLGVMLYTMLIGRYPFNDPDHGKLFAKIRRGFFTIPESLTPNVRCLIRCLLRKDPLSRLGCDEILRHPWIVEQERLGVAASAPGTHFLITNHSNQSQDGISRGYPTRRPHEVENSKDDQVVPVWNPPSKKTKV